MSKPNDTPLDEWSAGWLKLEIASILGDPSYLILTHDEKLDRDLPATEAEMRAFIRQHRKEAK